MGGFLKRKLHYLIVPDKIDFSNTGKMIVMCIFDYKVKSQPASILQACLVTVKDVFRMSA